MAQWRQALQAPIPRFLLLLSAPIFLLGLNLLLSWNHLERFAVLCGLELLVGMIAGWSVYLLRRKRDAEQEA